MVGWFVGAALVTLFRYGRVRDRRLLPLAAMFALWAGGLSQPDPARAVRWQLAAGAFGLVPVFLPARPSPHP